MSLPTGKFLNSELAQLEEEDLQAEQVEADITQAYIQALEDKLQAQALEIARLIAALKVRSKNE